MCQVVEINIMDYVNEEEIKTVVLDAFSSKVLNMSEKDLERVFSNGVYSSVRSVIDDAIVTNKLDLNLENKIKQIASEITSFNVFVDTNNFSSYKSVAQKLLDEAVMNNKQLLERKVKETFDKAYAQHEASQDLAQIMSEHVFNLFSLEG